MNIVVTFTACRCVFMRGMRYLRSHSYVYIVVDMQYSGVQGRQLCDIIWNRDLLRK